MDRLRRRVAGAGIADRGGHARPFVAPVISGGAILRRLCAMLIAAAAAIVVFHEFTARFAPRSGDLHTHDGAIQAADLVWALPAVALGAAAGAALIAASASRGALGMLERLRVPGLRRDPRAKANGLAWGAIGVLAVHFTREAFEVIPGGHDAAAVVIGSVLGFGAFRLHRNTIEHEAYRTFNLIAMLLAAGILASMSITPTGAWWTRNFSTLGTSDDFAAACFNVAIVVSGAAMAGMSRSLTSAVAEARFRPRRGGLATMRLLIVAIGVSLMGVGLLPIDGATDLHNAAAASAAGAFAVLCVGVQVWAKRLPRSLVAGSYASIAIQVIAMIAYDGIGIFNLTVFELVAFTLVFAWLIALVAITHPHLGGADVAPRRHRVRERRTPHSAVMQDAAARRSRLVARGQPPGRLTTRSFRPRHRSEALRDVQLALLRASDGLDEPPDALVVG